MCAYIYIYLYIYGYIYMHMYIYINIDICPPAPMNNVKIFNGIPPRDAPSKLVQQRYKTFATDQRGQMEMKNPTRSSNKSSTA